MEKIKHYFKDLFLIIKKREMRILPGHLAFFLVLSIMPIITLISFVCSYFSFSIQDILVFLEKFMPSEVEDLIVPILTNTAGANVSFVMMIIGFFIASNGAHSIILVSNMLYDIEDRDYLFRRFKALLILVMLMLIFVFIFVFIGLGNIILKFILSFDVIPNLADYVYQLFAYLKYPIAFFITFFFIKAIYTMAPDKKISSKYTSKGALFTTLSVILVTVVYSYYANNLANYGLWYGTLANNIVLMFWVYIISYIFTIGIAINANEYNGDNKKEIKINNK